LAHQPQQIIDRGMAECLVEDDLLAYNQATKSFEWLLDIVETEAFHKVARLYESGRNRRKGWSYCAAMYTQLKRQLPMAIEVYSNFLRQAMLPYVRIVIPKRGQLISSPEYRKAVKQQGKIKKNPFIRDRATVLRSGDEPGAESIMVSPDESVPAMPNLQPAG
jgi:hypothetical protein